MMSNILSPETVGLRELMKLNVLLNLCMLLIVLTGFLAWTSSKIITLYLIMKTRQLALHLQSIWANLPQSLSWTGLLLQKRLLANKRLSNQAWRIWFKFIMMQSSKLHLIVKSLFYSHQSLALFGFSLFTTSF